MSQRPRAVEGSARRNGDSVDVLEDLRFRVSNDRKPLGELLHRDVILGGIAALMGDLEIGGIMQTLALSILSGEHSSSLFSLRVPPRRCICTRSGPAGLPLVHENDVKVAFGIAHRIDPDGSGAATLHTLANVCDHSADRLLDQGF